MSFLSEVLAKAGHAQMAELKDNINEITDAISAMKIEVKQMMEDSYIKFTPKLQENRILLKRALTLSSGMDDLLMKLESQTKFELANSTCELKSLSESLQETALCLEMVNQLLHVDTELKAAKNEQTARCYLKAAVRLQALSEMLEREESLRCLDIWSALKAELSSLCQMFHMDCLELWRSSLVWAEEEVNSVDAIKSVVLRVLDGDSKAEAIRALHCYDRGDREMARFGETLLTTVLRPIMRLHCSVAIIDKDRSIYLQVEVKLKSKRPIYSDVFANLTMVFDFLFSALNFEITDGRTFVSELGELISDDFCGYLIKECLANMIPSKREQLESYSAVVNEIIRFEGLLNEKGFLRESNQSILEYANNVNVLFANKTCQCYLEAARRLMKKDLHNMTEVGPMKEVMVDEWVQRDVLAPPSVKQENYGLRVKKEYATFTDVSPNTFQFPHCHISKSVQELMVLVREVMSEAMSCTDLCAVKLFYTARNIFKMYCDIVPLHNRKLLDTIPQQAGVTHPVHLYIVFAPNLFLAIDFTFTSVRSSLECENYVVLSQALLHNNCQYLAHCLVTLGAELHYQISQSPVLAKHCTTFVDLVHPLRILAEDTLQAQLRSQHNQLIEIIKDSGLVTLSESPEFPPGIEKAIRQCLRQLALLQTVWQHVLPINVYCKVMGVLCNGLIEDLVQKVCAAEDIPADTATHLVQVFGIVQERAPLVFQEPLEVCRHVKRWARLCELTRVLGASLVGVAERWAEGKGPLAHEFTAEQVRRLVRALFQVSDRRAAVLARIK